jgi:hypothetical protein
MNRNNLTLKFTSTLALAISLFVFCQLSFGDVDQCKRDKMCYCAYLGAFYETVAEHRDQGEPPQDFFKALGAHYAALFSEKRVKKIINQVYFDPGFVNAGGARLNYQMRDICLGNTFRPLK